MSKYIKYNVEDSGVAYLTFGEEGKPVNTLGVAPLTELDAYLDDISANEAVKAVMLQSSKKDFIVGADINDIASFKTVEDTKNACLQMQGILNKLASLRVPTVAKINGQCLGGGLELALACDWRISEEGSKLGFPEIQLGLIPGAGGTQRTPRLIGLQAALDLILTGRRIGGKKAVKIGLVDDCTHPNKLHEVAFKYTEKKKKATKRGAFPKKNLMKNLPTWALENLSIGRTIMEKKTREMVQKNSKGFYPAPFKAVKAVFTGTSKSLSKGLDLEAQLFAELSQTKESKSLIHLFHATTHGKKNRFKEAGKDRFGDEKTELVGVIGAGFMGSGISNVLADKGVRVRMSDPSEKSIQSAMLSGYKYFEKKAKRRRIKPFQATQKLAHISPSLSTQGFASTDVVIEAVFENLDLKQKLLAEFDSYAHDNQVFASNTSALPIADIAKNTKNPERVLGMHFFSPVEKMPLLELVTTNKTADWATSRAFDLGSTMGKQTIVVKDSPGFYTTRALAFFLTEACLCINEGAKIETVDKSLTDFGFPVGPMTLLDEVGIDVGAHILETMQAAFSDRFVLPNGMEKIQESGRLGRKNGKGFYKYENGKKVGVDSSIYSLIATESSKQKPDSNEIVDRLLLLFINESVKCLEEGVLDSAYDGDVGAVFGLGFPPIWGGPFKYVDHVGAKSVVSRLEEFESKYGVRFTPAKLLKTYSEESKLFFADEV